MHIHLSMSAKEAKYIPGLVAGPVFIAQSRSTGSPHAEPQSIFSSFRDQKEQNSSSPQETAMSELMLIATTSQIS